MRSRSPLLRLIAFFAFVLPALFTASMVASTAVAQSSGSNVLEAKLDGPVDPVSARYIDQVVAAAQEQHATAVLITIDTPGGLDSSMRQMVQRLLSSNVPTIAYVWPSGARAASAGVFVAQAANVVAMAPGTNIGAAHPVDSSGGNIQSDLRDKITNDAAAYIASIAKQRGRNQTWVQDAVRQSVSLDAQSAVSQGVADLIAPDPQALLIAVDGRTVTTTTGSVTLHTKGAVLVPFDMNPFAQVLQTIIDPNVAYILMTIGFYAIIIELFHPGALVPGFTGAVCLILAFISFATLPLNWGGFLLILVAVVLFVLDVKAATHGVLTIAGLVCFVLGSLFLYSPVGPVSPSLPQAAVAIPALIACAAAAVVLAVVIVGAAIRLHGQGPVTGAHIIVGATGVAQTVLNPVGTVSVHGELWSARVHGRELEPGQPVRVLSRSGLTLDVEPVTTISISSLD